MLQDLMDRIRERMGAGEPVLESTARLRQLDHEVAHEQVLQFGAAVLGFLGAVLSLTVNETFILLPILAVVMLGQYAVQGWCPPVALLTRAGLRSSSDIDRERYAIAASAAYSREPRIPSIAPMGAD